MLLRSCLVLVVLLAACDSRPPLSADGGASADANASSDGTTASPTKRPELERMIDACVYAVSCASVGEWGQPLTMQSCLEEMASARMLPQGYGVPDGEVIERWYRCAETAKRCADFHACYGGTWPGTTLCREGGSCQDNKLTLGFGQTDAPYLDCGRFGATCVDLPTGAQRGCCVRSAEQCPATWDVKCDGTLSETCFLGINLRYDCARVGGRCNPQASGRHDLCSLPGETCDDGTFARRCDGSVIAQCVANTILRIDCKDTLTQTACQASTYPACAFAGSECKRGSADSCDDDHTIRFCLDGRRTTRNCRALGFSRCLATDDGHAQCVP
ncbi:MAG: hypothetical protein KC503_25075 [Myxococcales bacterium]|nr:hypothetical protein [Myxococcales bacterium]